MEKRVNNKARTYFQTFKDDIKNTILKSELMNDAPLTTAEIRQEMSSSLQYIYDYQPITFEKIDFQKRKRIKNIVPYFERCCALRANKEQCTRRRKGSDKFCGTHIKGIPHGEVNQENDIVSHTKKTVWAQDIKGIIYYIDNENNVYDPQDVLENNTNPKIIAKYVVKDNVYTIPSLFK